MTWKAVALSAIWTAASVAFLALGDKPVAGLAFALATLAPVFSWLACKHEGRRR